MLRRTGRALVGVAILAPTAVLVGCTPGPSQSTSPPSELASTVPSETPLPTLASLPVNSSSFPCAQPVPTAIAPTDPELEPYRDVIVSANTQPMATHACDTVTLIFSGSECCGPVDRDNALAQWGNRIALSSDWNFSPDPEMVAEWRTHFYAQYVPEGALIAVSETSGVMTSVIFDGNVITGLFTASLEEMMF